MQSWEIAARVLAIIIPIGLAFGLRIAGLIQTEDGYALRRFVVRVAVPVLVFFSMYDAEAGDLRAIPLMIGAAFLVCAGRFLLGAGASFTVRGQQRRAAITAATTMGNFGWLGFGVAEVLLGDAGLRRAVFFVLPWWPIFFTVGLSAAAIHGGSSERGIPWKRMGAMMSPILAALALGLGLNLGGVTIPSFLSISLRPIGATCVPLILFSVGLLLSPKSIGRSLRPALIISLTALVLGPFVGWAVARLLHADPVSASVIILEAGMPVATMIPVLREYIDMDADLAGTAVVLSTLLSLVSLPIVASLIL